MEAYKESIMIANLGERIQALRKEGKLSQEGLAEQVGVSRQAISKWERNEATPDVYNLSALAQAFNVSLDDLINPEGETSVEKVKLVRLDLKKKSEIFIIGAIIAYIVGTFSFLILPFSEMYNLFVFGVVIAGATGSVIYGAFINERFRMLNGIDKNEKISGEDKAVPVAYKQRKEAISKVISISATVIYLYLGFFKGLWHPGWIIFLLIPVANALYDVFVGGRIIDEDEDEV